MTTSQRIKKERRIQLVAFVALILSFILILTFVQDLLISFLLAFVYTYLLGPVVNYLERIGFKRTTAIILPFVGIFVLLSAGTAIVSPLLVKQMDDLTTELPKYIGGVQGLLMRWEENLNTFFSSFFTVDISNRGGMYLEAQLASFINYLPGLTKKLFTTSLLAPIFAFFMLKDGKVISRQVLKLVPNHLFELALSLSYQINQQLGDFIRARLLEAIMVGMVVWLGLTVIQFPYAIFLALFAALTNLIPYIGPFIGAIPAFVIAIINQDPSFVILLMSSVYFVAQIIDIVFIIPVLLARTVNLHPITVLVAFIIGAELMGVLGMIIAIPVTSVVKLTANTFYDHLVNFRA